MGNHHVGPRCKLVPFYRLPDKDNLDELMNIFKEFHLVPSNKLNFILCMSKHLQSNIDDKKKIVPKSERPRKRKKRRKKSLGRRRRTSKKKNSILQRWKTP